MKTVGIISEYNPFHNGHKYHIEEAKNACDADSVICVMSGNFVQRGEPSMFDKWSRAKMSVLAGADLVLELPFAYACQPAEIFAFGAVKLLNDTQIVNNICFGSELGNIDTLKFLASLFLNEPDEFKTLLRKYLNIGNTYPKAISLALRDYIDDYNQIPVDNILERPNNVLGIEYIKSIMRLNSNIQPVAVKRIISDYNETAINNAITSATSIRREISQNSLSDKVKLSMPKTSFEIIKQLFDKGVNPIFLNDFSDIILYQLRRTNNTDMKRYLNIKEGIEHRIKRAAMTSSNLEDLIDSIKTKRYTRTFIQRLICHLLMNLDEHNIQNFKNLDSPLYARVLAFNDKGKYLLKRIKDNETMQIINKVSNFKANNVITEQMFNYDLLATDIYCLGYHRSDMKKAGVDYYYSPIYV
jgi:predicted nucleotidyltransferase